MGFVDKIRQTSTLLDALSSLDDYTIKSSKLDLIWENISSLLIDGLGIVNDLITQGKPYPPDKLQATQVLANQVDLSWDAGLGNVTNHVVERSDDDGQTWNNISGELSGSANSYSDASVNPSSSYQYRVKAINKVGKELKVKFDWSLNYHLAQAFPEDITTGYSDIPFFVASKNTKINNVILYLENTGEDASNPLELELDVKVNGVSVFTTKPKITKDAADRSSTYQDGTGVTAGVLDDTKTLLSAGDLVTLDLILTRTPTPTDEMAGVKVYVDIEEGELVESDYSNVIFVTTPAT